MNLDTFIDCLEQYPKYFMYIFVSYDTLCAEICFLGQSKCIGVDKSYWVSNPVFTGFPFPVLKTNLRKCTNTHTYLNPYHYSIIHTNYIMSTPESRTKLKKIIEDVYVRLPSKVDIYRYKNDYDLSFTYR